MSKSKANTLPELKTSVVGVDLGSAFTKIAAVEKGVVDIITNEANLRQTPTIVGYGSNERLIGEAGNVKLKSNLNNSIISPQRFLGVQCQEYLSEEGKHAPCPLRQQAGEMVYHVNCQGQQAKVTPEQAVAAFFTKVRQIVELNNISSKFLTVAVPNFLTHQERQALLDSLEVARRSNNDQQGIQLVNESAAVGLDYGFYKKGEFAQKEEEAKNVMFVDFGHSKLSLYVIKFTKNYQKVVFQSHLRQVGCRNLDEQMLAFYSDLFENSNPNLEISVKESRKATIKLLENIEKQRKILSGNSEYDFNIDCLLEQCDLSYTMKRDQFQAIISPVIFQTKQFFLQCAEQLKTMGVAISSIELIGGGSRIPLFIRTVSEVFGTEPQRTLNSSECIARGAGLYSAMNSGIFRVQGYYSVELSPETLVCSWKGDAEEIQNEKNEICLLAENETIFSKKTLQIQLTEAKPSLSFRITTKNCIVDSNRPVCSFKVAIPQGTPERTIRLLFQLNSSNMINKVSALEVNQQSQTPLAVSDLKFYEHLPNGKISELAKIERQQTTKDVAILQHYENKNKFESNLYELKEKLSSTTRNADIKEFVNPKDYSGLIEYFQRLEDHLDSIGNFEQALKEASGKFAQFHQQIQDVKRRYGQVEKELHKFEQFIDNVVSGKVRRVKFYPKEEVEAARKWITEVQQQQRVRNKYQTPVTTAQQIEQRTNALKESIQRLEEELARSERQNSQKFHYQQQQQPRYEQKHYQNDHPGFNPYATTFQPRQYEHHYTNPRRGRNTSFNGYNSGIFSGFPGFF